MEKKVITDFLDSMMGTIEQKEIDLFKKIIDASNIDSWKDHEEFYHAVLYPFQQFVNGFVKSHISNNRDVLFIINNQRYIEQNFARLIAKKEGGACSADKSRTIMRSLLNHYKTGEEIVFDYDQEYTYHLPKKLFGTHDQIIGFYKGLKDLWYGDNRKYLEAQMSLLS